MTWYPSGLKDHGGIGSYRYGRDGAHRGRTFAAVDDVLLGEVCDRASDAQQGVSDVRFVLDGHQQWKVATGWLGQEAPMLRRF